MNLADLKAMMADVGATVEILSPSELAAALSGVQPEPKHQGYCWPTLGEPCGECHRCGGNTP